MLEKHETPNQTAPIERSSNQLVRIGLNLELWITPGGKVMVRLPKGENVALRSSQTQQVLRRCYRHATGKPATERQLALALDEIEGEAHLFAPKHEPKIRVAGHGEELFVDLANEDGEVVRISSEGWTITKDKVPVFFVRSPAARSLPQPTRGGSLDDLKPYVNVDEEEFPLLTGFIIGSFHPDGPYPVLTIRGEQGSAKSTTVRFVRALIDPNHPPMATINASSLSAAAANNWIIAADNVSSISPTLSDLICQVATGGGLASRQLYTNNSQSVVSAKRPVILNGIGTFVTRPDLLERTIMLELPTISPEKREREKVLDENFKEAGPGIMGAIFDALSRALRDLEAVHLDRMPRMADHCHWVVAATGDYSYPDELAKHQSIVSGEIVSNELIVEFIRDFLNDRPDGVWTGALNELLQGLERLAETKPASTARRLPGSATQLSNELERLKPQLSGLGIEYEKLPRTSKSRPVRLRLCDAGDAVTGGKDEG
jgi:hypothetical protein